MRVLFWAGNFWPHIGGAEVLAAKLLPALRERGYRFIVVTIQQRPDQPTEDRFEGIPVYRFPFRGNHTSARQVTAGMMKIRQQVARLKRDFAADLIHLNAVDPGNFFHLITADTHPAPLLVTLHNFLSKKAVGQTSWLQNLVRGSDWVSSVSAAVLAEARQLLPEIASRSSVLYNGLDTPPVPSAPLPVDTPRLLCLGRLITRKGFDMALSAFAAIVERFPRARLVVAGDGPARADLERQAAELRLGEKVEFTGWVEPAKVPALINTATMVVMPSQFEGLPLVALEAALMARPVVGTNAPGLSEAVVDGQTGLLIEKEDHRLLAGAIAFLLERPETAARMGDEACRRIREIFGWESCLDGYDALYRKLARGVNEDTVLHPIDPE